jgi:L-lysine 2,3-aminomutase
MVEKLKVTVKVLGSTFLISAGQLTPAERELKALEKAADLRQAQRDLMEGGEKAREALAIGSITDYKNAQADIEDAQTEIKKQKLTERADVERKAADKALDAGAKALRRRRDKEVTVEQRASDKRSSERRAAPSRTIAPCCVRDSSQSATSNGGTWRRG